MTTDTEVRRRLACIVAADIVSYSAMMAQDEGLTLDRRSEIHATIKSIAAAASGRLFGVAGDGFLTEFESPVEAVRAANDIQAELALRRERDASYPQLRIGVHLADVVSEGEDLLGDGINVAVRIEGVSEPGAVTVSQQVLDQVKRTARLSFKDIGDWSLKNIPDPVRLFRVVGEQPLHSYASSPKTDAPPDVTRQRDRPSVLVMPFSNLSGDPDQDYFVDGFSEDLVTELARFKALFVIARNATLAYRGKQADASVAGRELGVSHCVIGSLRKQANQVRIAIQLVRATSGETIWAEKFDAPLDQLFDIQDKIAVRVAATVVGKVEADAAQVAKRKRPADLGAYDCLLRGLEFHRLGGVTRDDAEQALQWFDRAVELDPDYGRAHAWRACAFSGVCDWTGDPWIEQCIQIARLALALDPDDAEVYRIMGSISIHAGDLEKALGHFKRALEINPNHAYLVAKSAEVYNYLCQPETALDLIAKAKEIDPYIPEDCLEEVVVSYYLQAKFREGLAFVARLERPTRKGLAYAVACGFRTGDNVGTMRAVAALQKTDHHFTVSTFAQAAKFLDVGVREQLVADLLAAGLHA